MVSVGGREVEVKGLAATPMLPTALSEEEMVQTFACAARMLPAPPRSLLKQGKGCRGLKPSV